MKPSLKTIAGFLGGVLSQNQSPLTKWAVTRAGDPASDPEPPQQKPPTNNNNNNTPTARSLGHSMV